MAWDINWFRNHIGFILWYSENLCNKDEVSRRDDQDLFVLLIYDIRFVREVWIDKFSTLYSVVIQCLHVKVGKCIQNLLNLAPAEWYWLQTKEVAITDSRVEACLLIWRLRIEGPLRVLHKGYVVLHALLQIYEMLAHLIRHCERVVHDIFFRRLRPTWKIHLLKIRKLFLWNRLRL